MARILYVGIDLGITSRHEAAVYDVKRHEFVVKSHKFTHTFGGYKSLMERMEKVSDKDTEFVFCTEPTSNSWVPICVFLVAKGHRVYRVTTQKSSDLRKFFRRYHKSNHIDAKTLAKVPLVDDDMCPVYIPDKDIFSLQRYCKEMDRIESDIARMKNRIQAIVQLALPGLIGCFGDSKFTKVAISVYRKYIDPHKVKSLGLKRLAVFLKNHAHGEVDEELAQKIYDTALSTIAIYSEAERNGTMPIDYKVIQDEVNMELDRLEFNEKISKEAAKKVKALYNRLDPYGIMKTESGFGDKVAPVVMAFTGDSDRFGNVRKFRSFSGNVPRSKATGNKRKKGLPITGAGCNLIKKYLHIAAEASRQRDLEDARFYTILRSRGLHHTQAVTAIANKKAGVAYALLKRKKAFERREITLEEAIYRFRDLEGRVIPKELSRVMVLEKFPPKRKKKERALLSADRKIKLNRGSLSHNRDNSSNIKALSRENYTTNLPRCQEKI